MRSPAAIIGGSGGADAYIGARHAQARAGDFLLGAWFVDAFGDRVEAHGHDQAHFMMATSGAYRTTARGEAGPGAPLIFNPPQTWHADRFESPGSFFSVTLTGAAQDALDAAAAPRAPTLVAEPLSGALARRLLRLLGDWSSDLAPVAEALCLELLGASDPRPAERSSPRWLRTACEMMRERRAESLSIADVARGVGVHPYHLARTFRARYRCTPGQYLQGLRLERAAALLARDDLPLVDVALASGFADQSHLTKRFRAAYGLPPGEFRRRAGRRP